MQIQINQDKKELKTHGSFEFPVMISRENLFSYERSSFFWHWHPEIEITLVLKGEMIYQIENQTFHLKEGEGLFCNSNRLHTGHPSNDDDCVYMAMTFASKIIYGFESSSIQKKFVTPIILNSQLSGIHLKADQPWQAYILDLLKQIFELNAHPDAVYELEIQTRLLKIWLSIFQNTELDTKNMPSVIRERERLHDMLDYIHAHYQDKVTLDQLSMEINLCKSECCRFFKRYMNESIFDYLLHYRIEKSLPLLQETTKSITDIASETGFTSSCYFTKIFKEQLGCTPREYRKGADH